jgi:hypothetical protein
VLWRKFERMKVLGRGRESKGGWHSANASLLRQAWVQLLLPKLVYLHRQVLSLFDSRCPHPDCPTIAV